MYLEQEKIQGLTLNAGRDLLRKWRENNERRSLDVIEVWKVAIRNNLDKLGNEKYIILEQVFVASLDAAYLQGFLSVADILHKEFPKSLRVLKHKAMLLEAKKEYTKALELLDVLIEKDETNPSPRKRRIAVFIAQGQIQEAIKELTEYLKKFTSDMEAWQKLSELYLSVGDYSKAVFCAEELLLHQPYSHFLHQYVADIRYTMGGVENLELARSYYCQALKFNPDNLRALFGVFLSTNTLLSQNKGNPSGTKRKELWKLNQWAMGKLIAKYKTVSILNLSNKVTAEDSLVTMLSSLAVSKDN